MIMPRVPRVAGAIWSGFRDVRIVQKNTATDRLVAYAKAMVAVTNRRGANNH